MLRFVDIVLYRSWSELRSERKRSMAGFLWWIFRPLMMLGVYAIVFGVIFHNEEEYFKIFLFSGIIAWEWFAGVVLRSSNSLITNRPLMLLVKVDPAIFPLSYTIVDGVKFLPGLLILVVGCFVAKIDFTWTMLMLPIIILLEFLLCAGIAMLVASITPLFPDFHMFLMTAMQLIMFMSGIFYQIGNLPVRFANFLMLNPMASIISMYRDVLIYGVFPPVKDLIYVFLIGIGFMMVGYALLRRFAGIYTKRW